MHRSSHFQGYNATSQYKDAAGYGVLSPICDPTTAIPSTLSTTLTYPYHSTSLGSGAASGNVWHGICGRWHGSYANLTVYRYSINLETGALISTASIGGVGGYPGPVSEACISDVPIFVYGGGPPDHGGFTLSDGVQYRYSTGKGAYGGTRSVFKKGRFYWNLAGDAYVRRSSWAVENGTDNVSVLATSSANNLGINCLEYDGVAYVYGLSYGTITVMNHNTLATVATLTHPQGSNQTNNFIWITEQGELIALGNTTSNLVAWKHLGNNNWVQIGNVASGARPGYQVGNPNSSISFMHRRVVYQLAFTGGGFPGDPYALYKCILIC